MVSGMTIDYPTTSYNNVPNSNGIAKDSSNKIDPADAAFWELDNIVKGGRLYTWLDKQLRIAVTDVLLTKDGGANATSSTPGATIENIDLILNNTVPVLHQNLLNSLLSLQVVDAPEEIIKEITAADEDDDDNDSNQGSDNDDDNDDDDDDDDNNNDSDDDRRPKKRQKVNNNKKSNDSNTKGQTNQRKRAKPKIRLLQDPFKVWFQISSDDIDSKTVRPSSYGGKRFIIWNEEQDDIPETVGGKLAVLSIGGILNAMVAIQESFDPNNPAAAVVIPAGLSQSTLPNCKLLAKLVAANPHLSQAIAALCPANPAACLSVHQLHSVALRLHHSIEDQVKLDILQTTPYRIQQMLAADLTPQEFANVRKRVYDTVILGKGTGNAAADDEDAKEIPTASANAQGVHDIEKFKKCPTCGNNDQSEFILDRKNGDVICSNCGTVVSESLMHEGSQFRKFEGEVDRNHHGDAANPLYSNAHNMSTSLSGVQPTTGAGIGGWGSGGGGRRSLETILKNAHAYTELNVSQFGKNDRRTRVGYKDRQKKDAFVQITHTGEALNLHDAVIQRSKELFAGFRDDRELIQQFKGVLAACLCEAFEQLSAEGKNLLKQQTTQKEQQEQISIRTLSNNNNKKQSSGNNGDDTTDENDAAKATAHLSSRAARRQILHHANLAGKGGLFLNNKETTLSAVGSTSTIASATGSIIVDEDNGNEKPAASWDLEDCRTWLLEASRRIAQAWVEERHKADSAAAKKYPAGPIEEIEGQLVEYSILLCEQLETEWRSHNSGTTNGGSNGHEVTGRPNPNTVSKKRVVTPRVNDMSKLGIKWQGAHERGSGGKGGVGNNARSKAPGATNPLTSTVGKPSNKAPPGATNKNARTAGQILILKTAQKLGSILNDPLAGEAFHKELRAVIGRQEEKKRKALREEATRQRFHQMQRKPWLTARVQQD